MVRPIEPVGVLYLVDCLHIGGTERQMVELLKRLDRRRFRPLVACFKPGGELVAELGALGIEPAIFPLHGSLLQPNTALQILRMAQLCRREQIRILQSFDYYSNMIGIPAARCARIRAIAGRRDLAHWLSPRHIRGLRFTLGLADCVIANAEAVAQRVHSVEKVAVHKIRVVPNGIDLARFDRRQAEPPSAPLPPRIARVPRVATVASMYAPNKGHADLLQAIHRLNAAGVRAQYLLISDGALRPALEEKTRELGLRDWVHFVGRRDDVPAILATVDLLVHPSWAEGFPNAVLEAMAAKKPVIASAVGGIPEVMRDGETGLLVPPRQPARLAQAMAQLLTDSPRAERMGASGRKRVEMVYSLDRMGVAMESIYDALLHGTPLPTA